MFTFVCASGADFAWTLFGFFTLAVPRTVFVAGASFSFAAAAAAAAGRRSRIIGTIYTSSLRVPMVFNCVVGAPFNVSCYLRPFVAKIFMQSFQQNLHRNVGEGGAKTRIQKKKYTVRQPTREREQRKNRKKEEKKKKTWRAKLFAS